MELRVFFVASLLLATCAGFAKSTMYRATFSDLNHPLEVGYRNFLTDLDNHVDESEKVCAIKRVSKDREQAILGSIIDILIDFEICKAKNRLVSAGASLQDRLTNNCEILEGAAKDISRNNKKPKYGCLNFFKKRLLEKSQRFANLVEDWAKTEKRVSQ